MNDLFNNLLKSIKIDVNEKEIIKAPVYLFLLIFVVFAYILSGSNDKETAQSCNIIDELPFTIDDAGRYCLIRDIETTENGIKVTSDNVTIDLSGFSIIGDIGPTERYWGINGTGFNNLVVENGRISGFAYGIYSIAPNYFNYYDEDENKLKYEYFPTGHHVYKNLIIDNMTIAGIFARGANIHILDNNISQIGGNRILLDEELGKYAFTYGIWTTGSGLVIKNNRITGVRAHGLSNYSEAIGIAVTGWGENQSIIDNIIVNFGYSREESQVELWRDNSESTYAIWVGGEKNNGPSANVVGNMIQGYNQGIVIKQNHKSVVAENIVRETRAPFVFRSIGRKRDGGNMVTSKDNICDIQDDVKLEYRFTEGCVDFDHGDYLKH